MIDAKTAREKTCMKEDLCNYIEKIEKAVNDAIDKGFYSATLKHSLKETE